MSCHRKPTHVLLITNMTTLRIVHKRKIVRCGMHSYMIIRSEDTRLGNGVPKDHPHVWTSECTVFHMMNCTKLAVKYTCSDACNL